MLITDFNLYFFLKPSAPSPFHSKNLIIVHLAVLLQSCLNARAGDIVQSRGYTADEFMKWNHVELSFRTDAVVRGSSRGPGHNSYICKKSNLLKKQEAGYEEVSK